MSFKVNKYTVVKNAISYELANFCFNYFLLKRDTVKFAYDNRVVSQSEFLGKFNDPQVPNSYAHYGDFVMETLMMKLLPLMKQKTELDLIPTYSYARIYEKGNELKKHKDRPSCEISTTLNLGGDLWPIFVDNKKIELNVGDMLIYRGCELEHWREIFEGNLCGQVFLHYNDINGPYSTENFYDKRPMLGLPIS
jgi:hypothetical protein